MSVVAADPSPIASADGFVIGGPVGRVDALLPLARLPDILEPDDGDRPPLVGSIGKLVGVTAGIGVVIAAAALGVTFFAVSLLG